MKVEAIFALSSERKTAHILFVSSKKHNKNIIFYLASLQSNKVDSFFKSKIKNLYNIKRFYFNSNS